MMDISFHSLWVFLLLPLPILLAVILPRAKTPDVQALRVPFYQAMQQSFSQDKVSRSRFILWASIVVWILLVISAARPQLVGEAIELPVTGRSLMMAVDISESMLQQDMEIAGRTVNRLRAVKLVAGEFIEQRVGDRIGLILYGTNAYLQAPLTFDRKTVRILLNEAAIGLAGKTTAIGDAIGLAIKRLLEQKDQNRILILLTDGENTDGHIEPLKAADLAAKEGVKIYTIGIGSTSQLVRGFFGGQRVQNTSIDEDTLKAIASKTGGKYFRATDVESLKGIYELLDKLEPSSEDNISYRPVTELYYWPLQIALFISLLLAVFVVSPLTSKFGGK